MKRHRKFESWLADVRRQLVRPTFDGPFSEFTALDRIDDWKERNDPWRRAQEVEK